jgi:transcriptional regulator with XRE-family HTH domain
MKKKMSDAAGVSLSQLGRYISGESQPTIEPLVRMAEAAGVNLDWLATGRGSKLKADVALYEKYDVETLTEAIETTEVALEAMKRKATPQNKAELILLVYGVLTSEGTDKKQRSAAVLKLLNFSG